MMNSIDNTHQDINHSGQHTGFLYSCRVFKKKFLGTAVYSLSVYENCLELQKEKKNELKSLKFEDIKRVVWRYSEEKKLFTKKVLKGLQIDHSAKVIELWGEEAALKELKGKMARFVFQAKVQDEYEAQQVIGQGNYALVLELRNIHTEAQFASKCIDKKKLNKVENGMKAVLNEIHIMRHLSPHSGIINLHEVYEGDNNIYLVMDFAQGGSLYNEMKARKNSNFTRKEAQEIMRHLLTSLAYMHKKNIMHRDLKPENILYQAKGDFASLKLADFGLSTFIDAYPYLYPKCGTPGFVAPEVANLSDKLLGYSQKCDIFSAGVIFHILLFGYGIFSGKGHLEILKNNKACEIDLAHERYEQIDSDARNLLFKMLEKNPKERWSADQVLQHPFFFNENPPLDISINIVDETEQYNPDLQKQCSCSSPQPNSLVKRESLVTRTPLYHRKNSQSEPDILKHQFDWAEMSNFSLDSLERSRKLADSNGKGDNGQQV